MRRRSRTRGRGELTGRVRATALMPGRSPECRGPLLCRPPEGWQTTYNARTYLQPQLNKAVRYAERATSSLADNNPKDFLLYSEGAFEGAGACARDNTGQGSYVEGLPRRHRVARARPPLTPRSAPTLSRVGTSIPTLTFPSDHCIVSTTLRLR